MNDLWGKSGEVPAAKAEEASEGGMGSLIHKEKAKSVRSAPLPRSATADVEDTSPLFTLEETKILDANGQIHDVVGFCESHALQTTFSHYSIPKTTNLDLSFLLCLRKPDYFTFKITIKSASHQAGSV